MIAVIGAGPAGLMAADTCIQAGAQVEVFDRMPSAARKFLLAGKGGLNLTHAEPSDAFLRRYGGGPGAVTTLRTLIEDFDANALRAWADALGAETFVGTSGRVFPREMKAAPLLRAWVQQLRRSGVQMRMRHRLVDWRPDGKRWSLVFERPDEQSGDPTRVELAFDAVILALGGASWSRLGSDGSWQALLSRHGVGVSPLQPANCGFDIGWQPGFSERFAGAPMKAVAVSAEPPSQAQWRRGEFVVTATGIEGSLIYTIAPTLRDRLANGEAARLWIDLRPDLPQARIREALERPRGSRSMANHLRARVAVDGVKAGLLREVLSRDEMLDPARLSAAIKALPLTVRATRPIDEAISTAGGVRFDALGPGLMLSALPGVFCAGEMLDWEAPTGGYLLTACFATGRQAGKDALAWLAASPAATTG